MKKVLTLMAFSAGILVSGTSFAQKNVIKTRPIRTIVTAAVPVAPIDLNLTYERVIVPKLSLAFTFNYGLERDLSTIVEFLELDDQVSDVKTKGIAFAPEIRFYPGIKETPRGLYILGEVFYRSNTLSGNYLYEQTFPFTLPDNSIYSYDYQNTFTIEGTSSQFGGAIGLGTQWLFGDHFSLDILWIGLGAGVANTSYTVDGALIDQDRIIADLAAEQSVFTEAQIAAAFDPAEVPTWIDIEQQLSENVIDEINANSITQLSSSASASGIEITSTGPAVRMRFLHIALGVAF